MPTCGMHMIIPPALQPGDSIRLIATARYVQEELVQSTEERLKKEGFQVARGKNLMARHFQFAGTDAQRKADLQTAMDDPDVKAIFVMRGGYGSHRILEGLDFKGIKAQPKWLVGFSDVTAIHGLFQSEGIATLHAAMPSTYYQSSEEVVAEIPGILKAGQGTDWVLETHEMSIPGEAEGRLVGGNLSVLISILGTGCFSVSEGDILMIEDLDEMLYHVDRMMLQLSRAGILQKLSGLIIGGFSAMKDNTTTFGFSKDDPFGMSAEEIILGYVRELGIPVMVGAPVGHILENRPIVLGAGVKLSIDDLVSRMVY